MKQLRSKILIGFVACAVALPVYAQLAVIDPANLVQNSLTALRELQQVNNEIQQLANEAVMLTNEAKNLTAINYNVVPRLLAILGTTNQLLNQAQGLSLNLAQTEAQFALQYPSMYPGGVNNTQMAQDAYVRWKNSLEALRTSVEIQSQSNQNFASDQTSLSDLVNQSQNAEGALGAIQATNQLLALHARQFIQEQELVLAQGRATAMEQAREVAAQERSRQVRLLFTADWLAYTPQAVGGFGP
jgi:P-type conjugative transfer protein TrbJ